MEKDSNCSIIIMIFLFTILVGISFPAQTSAENRTAVENFVTRFYELCFSRSPDSAFLNAWVSALLDGDLTVSDVSISFLLSPEFEDRNTTQEEYITILYEGFFNRKPDPGGLRVLLDEMDGGASREDVLNRLLHTDEFRELCSEYGIKAYQGFASAPQTESVKDFVTRFYRLCLGRNPDSVGFDGWVENLLNQIQTGEDIANGFIYSQEFINKNTTDQEYLTILYKAFFNRDPDPASWDEWLSELDSGKDRTHILNGFVYSQEFEFLCRDYGILPYHAGINCVLYGKIVDKFSGRPIGNSSIIINSISGLGIKDLKFPCLPDGTYIFPSLPPGTYLLVAEAPGYNTKLRSEIVLQEAETQAVVLELVPVSTVENIVKRFYQMCLGREPDDAGLEIWTNNLLNQIQTGADVAHGFIFSPEFLNKNTTNDVYLTILYKAFFNRKPDQAGWDVWLAELNAGRDRGYVLDGFLFSPEFIKLCDDNGITPF